MNTTPFRESADSRVIQKVNFLEPRSAEKIQVRSGDTYVFTCDVSTRAGHMHPRGSLLYVHDATQSTPHNEIGPHGSNWICRTQFSVSVWATLEQCIERGLMKRLQP
jgi:hypothetical protein